MLKSTGAVAGPGFLSVDEWIGEPLGVICREPFRVVFIAVFCPVLESRSAVSQIESRIIGTVSRISSAYSKYGIISGLYGKIPLLSKPDKEFSTVAAFKLAASNKPLLKC